MTSHYYRENTNQQSTQVRHPCPALLPVRRTALLCCMLQTVSHTRQGAHNTHAGKSAGESQSALTSSAVPWATFLNAFKTFRSLPWHP